MVVALPLRTPLDAAGGTVRQTTALQAGISSDKARAINKFIKEHGPKGMQSATQGEQVRITAKKRDDLQSMIASLKAEDPGARPVPYALSGGTDAKSFSRLGIRGFGFAPLRLPADLDFSGMFHGVDERVPLDALRFGVRVLDRFLDAC